ncbi:MAG TPA: hypothetical protein VEI97_03720 [bacterium]|nr:hypothetical protein [bacterium]
MAVDHDLPVGTQVVLAHGHPELQARLAEVNIELGYDQLPEEPWVIVGPTEFWERYEEDDEPPLPDLWCYPIRNAEEWRQGVEGVRGLWVIPCDLLNLEQEVTVIFGEA